jgi:hypothetical protein
VFPIPHPEEMLRGGYLAQEQTKEISAVVITSLVSADFHILPPTKEKETLAVSDSVEINRLRKTALKSSSLDGLTYSQKDSLPSWFAFLYVGHSAPSRSSITRTMKRVFSGG